MSKSFDPTTWTHCLIQFELASLALRYGWGYEFEQTLPTGTPGDVRLEKDGGAIAVEVTTVATSVPQQEAMEFFHNVAMRLLLIEAQYHVHFRGAIGDIVPLEEIDLWIQDIEEVARSTAQDQLERFVGGPAEAALWVTTDALAPNETQLLISV